MSGLSSILNSAVSGLNVAQTQLRVVSDNVANVNTPGYVRKTVAQSPRLPEGVLAEPVARAANQFLQAASLAAQANSSAADAFTDMLGRAQALFGDPSSGSGYFNGVDQALSAFATLANTPNSSAARNQALNALNNFLGSTRSLSQSLASLSNEAGDRIGADVGAVNDLLGQIDQLNKSIMVGKATGTDVTGAQDTQSQVIDQLSKLLDVTVNARSDGGVDVRGTGGVLLVGRAGASVLGYATAGAGAGQLTVTSPAGAVQALSPGSGEIQALLTLRNSAIPDLASQLGEYAAKAVQQINAAHNASTTAPPQNTLSGRDIGIDLDTAANGFTGKTSIAVTDSSGVLQRRVDIDFDARTFTVGGVTTAFSGNFLADLNSALGPAASASFAGGALSLQATGSGGVAIADDPTTPAQRGGMGFSQYFGLNDLISSNAAPYTATGLKPTDANGFTGGVVSLRITDAMGQPLQSVDVTIPSGGTMNDVLSALNDTATGVGLFGAFSLDSNGVMSFAPSVQGARLQVTGDTSAWNGSGASVSGLFGLDPAQKAARVNTFSLRSDIAASSSKLAVAQLDLNAAVGQVAVSPGDGRGASLMSVAATATTAFDPAGALGGVVTNLSQYAGLVSGQIGQAASTAAAAKTSADQVASSASATRASAEGVNLDEELTKLTTYQQAYAASTRLIQAVSDMYNALLNIQ